MFFMLHVGSFGLSSLHGPMDNNLIFSTWEVPLAKNLKNAQTLVAKMWPASKKIRVKLNSISPKEFTIT
jgi:hypothetical protein